MLIKRKVVSLALGYIDYYPFTIALYGNEKTFVERFGRHAGAFCF
jgi:hypothetical protein